MVDGNLKGHFFIKTLLAGLLFFMALATPAKSAAEPATSPLFPDEENVAFPSDHNMLWQRIVKNVAEDGGYTPRDRVERVLGIKFSSVEYETDPPTLGASAVYRFNIQTKGLGKVEGSLFDDPKFTALDVEWGKGLNDAVHCVNRKLAVSELIAAGWHAAKRWPLETGREEVFFFRPGVFDNNEFGVANSIFDSHSWLHIVTAPFQSECIKYFGTRVLGNAPWFSMALAIPAKSAAEPGTSPLFPNEENVAFPGDHNMLWQRIVKLVAEDGGYTPRDRVERVLGIKFSSVEYETDPPTLGASAFYRFKARTAELGEFQCTLFDDPKFTGLAIGWGGELNDGVHCVDQKLAVSDITATGWRPASRWPLSSGRDEVLFFRPGAFDKEATKDKADLFHDESWLHILTGPFRSGCIKFIGTQVSRDR